MLSNKLRIKSNISLVVMAGLLAACGGGGGGDSGTASNGGGTTTTASNAEVSTSSGSSAANQQTTQSATGTQVSSAQSSAIQPNQASGNEPVILSLAELPYRDPAQLVELISMSAAAYDNLLQNDWPYVENILRQYVPANVTIKDAPRLFSGVMTSCLQDHGAVACREYMNSLITLNKNKQPQ